MEMFLQRAGVRMNHISYRGATPALVGFILRDHIIGRALLTGIQSTD